MTIIARVFLAGIAVVAGFCSTSAMAADPLARPGEPADLAPSAYQYRADRTVEQNAPESWILLMQYAGQPFDKPVDTQAPAVEQVLCGYLWEEVRPVRNVEVSWTGEQLPRPGEVSVIYLDTSVAGIHTWWNRQAPAREAELRATSGRRFFYTVPVDTFGIIVRCNKDLPGCGVPQVRIFGPDVWKQADVQIEWGFEPSRAKLDYDGTIEAYDGIVADVQPLAQDPGTTVTGQTQWTSKRKSDAQRGIRFSLLYIGTSRRPTTWPADGCPEDIARTIVTVKTKSGSFSFLAADLEHGPILANEYGFFVTRANSPCPSMPGLQASFRPMAAREFAAGLKTGGRKTIRQQVRELPEQTWQGAVTAMWPGRDLPPTPKPEFLPAMQVDVPDERLVAQWNLGAWHILRRAKKNEAGQYRFNDYPFAILASENHLILRALDLMGMHKEAADGLDQWLELPVDLPKPVGHFSDGEGALSHAKNYIGGAGEKAFKEDLGGGMDSVHAMGPGAIGYALAEHYWLTGDKAWLKTAAPRLIANADWILRQRRLLSDIIPGGERLACKGLIPAHQVTPDSGGMLVQFYESDAYYYLAVKRLAETVAEIDAEQGKRLAAEAENYRQNLLAAVERSIALTPVVPCRDGTSHSFIPFACYVRGFASGPWNWRRPGSRNHVNGLYWDTVQSAGPLISLAAILPVGDPHVQGFLDVLEDRLLSENERLWVRTPGYDPQRDFFARAGWQYQCGLERHADIHLAGDDIPCFIRSMLNQYAVDIQPGDYTFREHTVTGPPDKSFEESAFLERFRNLLVMEEGRTLWLARATPRAWLEQGKQIAVTNAPTHFGPISYEITSDVQHETIKARLTLPDRNPAGAIALRFRHPQGKPIRSVTVDGTQSKSFDPAKEIIRLPMRSGSVTVEARY